MNANELRIGNYFHRINRSTEINLPDTSTIFEVTAISIGGVKCIMQGEKPWEIAHHSIVELYNMSPIPISEEWHNRFGVIKNGFKSFDYQIEPLKKIVFSGDYVYMRDIEDLDGKEGMDDNICTLWSNDKKGRSMFVHEWQNLFYALTNQELELKN